MEVKATNKYKELNVQDAELKRIPKEGEEFEVSEERYNTLNGNNKYKEVFVIKIEDIEVATKKVETETVTKKTNKTTTRKKKQ